MEHRHVTATAYVLIATLFLVASHRTGAAEPEATEPAAGQAPVHALTPAKLEAIRSVGRNVLMAKKLGPESTTDQDQIATLRKAVDDLIAAQFDPAHRSAITVQGQVSAQAQAQRSRAASLRREAHTRAQDVTARLRRRADTLDQRAEARATDAHSGGLPIGAQRARTFARLSERLDTALAAPEAERLGQLRQLRAQLRTAQGGLVDAPRSRGTPTLQAMPAGFDPAKHMGAAGQ